VAFRGACLGLGGSVWISEGEWNKVSVKLGSSFTSAKVGW